MANPYNLSDDNNRAFEEFLERARREMVPKLRESEFSVSICPVDPTNLDLKFSLELGASIMLDKPIIAVVEPGQKVPERLVRVADEIVAVNFRGDAREASTAIQEAVMRVAERLGI